MPGSKFDPVLFSTFCAKCRLTHCLYCCTPSPFTAPSNFLWLSLAELCMIFDDKTFDRSTGGRRAWATPYASFVCNIVTLDENILAQLEHSHRARGTCFLTPPPRPYACLLTLPPPYGPTAMHVTQLLFIIVVSLHRSGHQLQRSLRERSPVRGHSLSQPRGPQS